MTLLMDITCGTAQGSMSTGTYVITEVAYGGGDVYARHAHQHAYVVLIRSGGFAEETSREQVELTSGDVLIMPAGQDHVDRIARRGASGLLVTLSAAFVQQPPVWRAHRGGAASRAMIALHRALRIGGSAELLSVEEHLLHALDVTANGRADLPTVRVAQDVIDAYATKSLRLADVATLAGVTSSYLARTFRRTCGRTMGSYLRSVRARHAAAMLGSSRDTLATVAAAAGFADQSHMTRVFNAEYGITPRQYRELMVKSVQDGSDRLRR